MIAIRCRVLGSVGIAITDHVLEVPVHTLEDAEDFLPVLADRVQESAPGERFAYNNAGFVLLALLAQRVAGEPFHDLVRTRVSRRRA